MLSASTRIPPPPAITLLTMVGLTWLFWWMLVAMGMHPFAWPGVVLYALGGAMPAVSCGLLLVWFHGRAEREAYVDRLISLRRIPLGRWAFLLGLPPLVVAAGVMLGGITSGEWGAVSGVVHRIAANPWQVLPLVGLLLLFGPIPEELAWRGYVLDRLEARYGAIAASLVLGAAWAIWHLPMFFMIETHHAGRGFGTTAFWMFNLAILGKTFVMTWIYHRTNRSTLAAIIFHFAVNASLVAYERTVMMDVVSTMVWLACAAAVVPALARQQERIPAEHSRAP